MDNNIYSSVLAIFVEPTKEVIANIAQSAVIFFQVQIVFNAFIAILVMMWAYKRTKEGDMFQYKTLISLIPFLLFVGFINWTIANPLDFVDYLHSVVFYPANFVMDLVSNSISHLTILPTGGTERFSISFLIQQSYNALYLLYSNAFHDLGLTNFISRLPQLILFLFVIIAEVAFIALVLLIVLIVNVETYVWLAFGILFLPLILFKQTVGIAFTYLKKLISLSLYQPAMYLFAFFNFSVIFAIVRQIPSKEEMEQGFFGKASNLVNANLNGVEGYVTIMGYFTIIIIGAAICFYLVRRTPDFINNLFGTSGGVGGTAELVQKMATQTIGAISGGIAGQAIGNARNAYQQAGGGIGGVMSAIGTAITGGAAQIGGVAGKAGAKINNGIQYGIENLKGGTKK